MSAFILPSCCIQEASNKCASVRAAPQPAADGGWMGSLASRLLRALFNTTLRLNSVVIRALHGEAALSLQCGTLTAFTPLSNWRQELQVTHNNQSHHASDPPDLQAAIISGN